MATAAAELLRTLPQPQVSITVGYSLAQKLALVALCLRQAGLERTLSVLEREAAVKGVDLVGASASAGAGAKAVRASAEGDAVGLEKHTALCLAELQREAAGGEVAVACVMVDPAPRGAAKQAQEPPPRPSPTPKPAARAAEAHTLDDILGDDVDYSDDEEDAGDTRREEDAKPTPVAASHEPRKSRETPQRSEGGGGARESRGRVDERAVGIEPPRGAAPRPTWIGNGKEPKGDRDRERQPARGAPAATGRDWQREPVGWERGRAEPPRRDEPPGRREGLPPPPPLPAGRMSGGRGPPLPPPPPPPPPPHYGRQAPLPPPPPGKRQRY